MQKGKCHFDRGSSKGRLDIQDKPRFKKRTSNQGPTKFMKELDERVSNSKSQKGKGTSSLNKKNTCRKCGKRTKVICSLGQTIVFYVEIVAKRLGNGQILSVRTSVVGKIKLVVLM